LEVKEMTEQKYIVNIDENRCKGCGHCIKFCPKEVLEFSKKYNEKGYHYAKVSRIEDCIGCGFCYQMCPDVCISIKVLEKIKS
jgi:2-oxoglutarate ferredoxin oxidoreductase subunit delta